MIRLQKTAKPRVLEEKGADWRDELVRNLSLGTDTSTQRNRYRHPEIKNALVAETHGKCAYCESKVRHIHHGDVEHVYPKSLDVNLTFVWENLTLACEICNQNKSNRDPSHSAIIDPYSVNPEEHLIFLGPLVFTTGTAKGLSTRYILDLDSPELTERRKEALEKIIGLMASLSRDDIHLEVRKAILCDLKNHYACETAEYSAMMKTAIAEFLRHLPAELQAALAA